MVCNIGKIINLLWYVILKAFEDMFLQGHDFIHLFCFAMTIPKYCDSHGMRNKFFSGTSLFPL